MKEMNLVIFDADNTLIDFHKCERFALEYLFEKLNLHLTDEIATLFSATDRSLWASGKWEGIRIETNAIPLKRFELLFSRFNIKFNNYSLANNLFCEGLSKAVYPLDNVHEIVEYLFNKNIKICIATNGLVQLQYPRIINTSFGKYITKIVASEEVGKNKPNPKIFNKILKFTKVKNEHAIMVGDSLTKDILGAKNANIKSIWFNPKGLINNSNVVPNHEIKSLLEIKKLFE